MVITQTIFTEYCRANKNKNIYMDFFSERATGFASAKIGRLAAFTIGGAIILLEVANEQGIIKIDWSRLTKKVDQVGDKVQEAVTGEGPKWMEKVKRTLLFAHIFTLNSDACLT